MVLRITCSNCLHEVMYNISRLIEEDDVCRLFCEKCSHILVTVSTIEREKMIQGIKVDRQICA
jgi:RNase P subunit RPR2